MPRRGALVSLLTVALIAPASAWGFGSTIAVGMNEAAGVPAPTTPFRASATLETDEQNIDLTIYYTPGFTRDEMQIGPQNMVMLNDLSTGKMRTLMPQGIYMEFESGTTSEQIQEFKLIERTVVGKEEFNGFDTTKYKVIYEGPDGKYGGFSWFTDDNIAVRAFMVSEEDGEKQRVQFQIKELERSPQQMSLFQVPSNYRKLDIGGFDLSSMMPGAAGQAPAAAAAPSARPKSYANPAPGGDAVLQMVQQNLSALGYNTGNTDGLPSTETTIAISQFQAKKGVEVTGEASPQLAGMLAAEAGQQGGDSSGAVQIRTNDPQALQAARQECLQQKIAAAQEKKKKKRGFGSLLRAASRVAAGGAADGLGEIAGDLYDAHATLDDLSSAAKDLGIAQSDIEACQNAY